MRALVFANNRVGAEGLPILREAGAEIAGLVVHPPEQARHRDRILERAGLPPDAVLEAGALRTPEGLDWLRGRKAGLGVSLYFGYILRPEVLSLFPRGVVNLHPGLLPWNRGTYTNVWTILDRTPAGATLHWIDPGVDTGDIIHQREMRAEPWDTGRTLHEKLEETALSVLREAMPGVLRGVSPRRPQPSGGTGHRKRDVEAVDEIRLDESYRARDLIDLLRARTFPPYRGAYFTTPEGRRVHLRLELEPEEER